MINDHPTSEYGGPAKQPEKAPQVEVSAPAWYANLIR